MRDVFIQIIKAEKARGATIIMSNHMFDELEETCDYVGFIKDGHLIDVVDMNALRNLPYRDYEIKFGKKENLESIKTDSFEVLERNDDERTFIVRVDLKKTNEMIKEMQKHEIVSFSERKHTLEEYFVKDVESGGKEDE